MHVSRWLAFVLVFAALPAAHAGGDVVSERYAVDVNGDTAFGWAAWPAHEAPTTLLVYGHPCCGKPDQLWFVEAYARAYGVAAVAMDYRGPGGWDVWAGHEDLIAATEDLQSRFPIETTVLWGVSMGGETTGLAAAARPDLFDYWVDTFGVTNLFEQFVTLGLYPGVTLDPSNPGNPTRSAIIHETGGTPATAPDEYAKRSPVFMADAMVGVKRAYLLHGIGDPVVPYSMTREMFAGLEDAGVPSTFYTFLTRPGDVQYPWPTPRQFACPPCVTLPPATPFGFAAHDMSGGWAESFHIVERLLHGVEPDADAVAVQLLVDASTGQRARV